MPDIAPQPQLKFYRPILYKLFGLPGMYKRYCPKGDAHFDYTLDYLKHYQETHLGIY